jgi:hypothetical protein
MGSLEPHKLNFSHVGGERGRGEGEYGIGKTAITTSHKPRYGIFSKLASY